MVCLLLLLLSVPAFAQAPDAAALYQSGVKAFERGDCEAALEYFSDVTDIDNFSDTAFFAMARVSYLMDGKKDLERTLEYAQTAVRLNPAEYSYQKFLASVYLQRFAKTNDEQDARKSEDALMAIIKAVPEDADAILMLAHVYGQRKDLQTEEMLLNKALAKDPENADIYSALGIVQLKRNPWENAPKAKEFFGKATALDPSAGHYGLAYLHFLQDNKTAAIQEYAKISDKDQRQVLADAMRERYGKIRLPAYKGPQGTVADEFCKDAGMLGWLKEHALLAATVFMVVLFAAGIMAMRN